jgi:hypothetical protein
MKQYLVDELRPADHRKLKDQLERRFGPADLGTVYWIPVEPALLTVTQTEHVACGPFYMAVELQEGAITCELLVRSRSRVRCSCIAYATTSQRNWAIGLIDDLFAELDIKS